MTESIPDVRQESVWFLAGLDYSAAEIADVLGMDRADVARMLRAPVDDAEPDSQGSSSPGTTAARRAGRPRALTADQLQRARELRGQRRSLRAIGAELGCAAETVRVALGRAESESLSAVPGLVESGSVAAAAAVATGQPQPAAEEWPPPVDEHTVWQQIRGPQTSVTFDADGAPQFVGLLSVRPVRLWGKPVLVNAQGEVWCPGCQEFRTTAQLSDPWNRCPVGLPARGGLRRMSADETARSDARLGYYDFFRVQW